MKSPNLRKTHTALNQPASRLLFPACLGRLLILFTILLALPASAATKGFIIYSEHDISDPTIMEFESISWKDGFEGKIKRSNGSSEKFINSWAKKIVYLDSAFYKEVDTVPKSGPMRAHVKSREVVVDGDPKEITSPGEANRLTSDIAAIGAVQREFPICTGILGPISRSLRQQLDRYNTGEHKQRGTWLTVTQVAEQKAKLDAEAAKEAKKRNDEMRETARMKFTFSTASGKTYQGVSLSGVDKSGFTIVLGEGVLRVSFDELLADISDLPPEVTDRVQEYRDAAIQRAKDEEAERKRTEEQKIAKTKEEQDRAALALSAQAEQKNALEKARLQREQDEKSSAEERRLQADREADAARAHVQSQPLKTAQPGQAQTIPAQEAKVAAAPAPTAKPITTPVQLPSEPKAEPTFYCDSNSTAVEISALAPILLIAGYVSKFKKRLNGKRKMLVGLGLYLCSVLVGFLVARFGFMYFDTDPTTILWLGIGLGTLPPLVCCTLVEAGSRIFGKSETEQIQDPELAATYVERAITKYNQRDYTGSIADCTKAICLDPNTASTYNIRGNALNDMGDQREAIADYSQAIELDPACALSYYNRANTRHDLGENSKAIADYSKAIELNPESDEFHNNRGVTYLTSKDFDKAIADFSRAIELNPRYASAHVNRGSAYSHKGEGAEALADYQKAVEIDPTLAAELTPQIEAYLQVKTDAE